MAHIEEYALPNGVPFSFNETKAYTVGTAQLSIDFSLGLVSDRVACKE